MQTLFTTDFLMVRWDFRRKVIRFFEVPYSYFSFLIPDPAFPRGALMVTGFSHTAVVAFRHFPGFPYVFWSARLPSMRLGSPFLCLFFLVI